MASKRHAVQQELTPDPQLVQQPLDERKLREERLLEAASALLVRWGYRKTTIDDVAREAGVGKGTVYLHWKDKNELFRAALWREQQRCSIEIQQRIAADPEGGLLHRVITHSMLAALSNPLIAAIFKGKSDIFNGFLGAYDPDLLQQLIGSADAYILKLQEAGLIRSDIAAPSITYWLTALKVGIINTPDVIKTEQIPSMEQIAEVFSDLVRRWLEPEHLPEKSQAGKQLFKAFLNTVNENV